MIHRLGIRLVAALSLATLASAQETRSAIQGRVYDQQNSAVANATVIVTNTDTNVSSSLTTNETGYYEANFLVAGNYRLTMEAPGFKKAIRSGLVLPAATRRACARTRRAPRGSRGRRSRARRPASRPRPRAG